MRKSFFVLLFICQTFSLFAQGEFVLATVFPSRPGANPQVGQFERLEYGITLPNAVQTRINAYLKGGEGINPYDPDQLDVSAVFTGPDGKTVQVFGFYYEEITNTGKRFVNEQTIYPVRIRFAPTSVGSWSAEVKIILNNEKSLPTQKATFNCIESDNKGYIVRAHDQTLSDRYLRLSKTGETFFAIGENMNWSGSDFTPQTRNNYDKWMPELSEAGGNFMRVGMLSWSYGIEWEHLGNYQNRQDRAMELDHIFFQAEKLDLKIVLHMIIHDNFNPPSWGGDKESWPFNPYNNEIDEVKEPIDFFIQPKAKEQYLKQVRYILARWGYSTSMGVYELFSEFDSAFEDYNHMATEMVIINKWFREVRDYIKVQNPERLVTASFATQENKGAPRKLFPDADVVFGHMYGRDEDFNYNKRWKMNRYLNTRYKTSNYPYILEEMGGGYGPIDACSDITFHNAIWATSLSGGFGCGMNWWWDSAIHLKGYQSNFKALKAFFSEEDLVHFQYQTARWNDSKIENIFLVEINKDKARGWVHNRSYWWPNMYNSNPCIKKLIDDDNGFSMDPSDNTHYAKWRAEDAPTPLSGRSMRITDLHPSFPWSVKSYKVMFYSTKGEGGHIAGKDVIVKTDFRGNLKVPLPNMDDANPDFGYKIERVVE